MHSDVFCRKKATEKKQKSSLFSINSVLCCGQWSNRNGARGAPWTRSLPVSPPPHHPPHSRSSDDVRELGSPRPPPRRRGRVGPAPPAVSRDARTTRSSAQATDPQKSARRRPLTKPEAGPSESPGPFVDPKPHTSGCVATDALGHPIRAPCARVSLCEAWRVPSPPPALLVDLHRSVRWLAPSLRSSTPQLASRGLRPHCHLAKHR